MREAEMQDWSSKMKPEDRKKYTLTDEIEMTIDRFFFNHYCQAFRSGAFARANCSMCVNIPFHTTVFFRLALRLFRELVNTNLIYSALTRPMANMCDDHGERYFKFRVSDDAFSDLFMPLLRRPRALSSDLVCSRLFFCSGDVSSSQELGTQPD